MSSLTLIAIALTFITYNVTAFELEILCDICRMGFCCAKNNTLYSP